MATWLAAGTARQTGRELRPDVVARILDDLERMTPIEQTEMEAS